MQKLSYFLWYHTSHPSHTLVYQRMGSGDCGWEFDVVTNENGYLVMQGKDRLEQSKGWGQRKTQTSNMIHGLSHSLEKAISVSPISPHVALESSVDYQITRAFGLSQNQQLGSHEVTGINTNRTSLSVTGPQDRPCYTCLPRKCTPGPPPQKPLATLISCFLAW